MHYKIALLAAGLIVSAVALFSWWYSDIIDRSVREHLHVQKQEGRLPPELQDADIDTLDLSNSMIRVPRGMHTLQSVAMILSRTWWIWGPVIVGVCFGLAALARRGR